MAPPSPDLRALNPASKEYLEAIFELGEEGQRILQARIGERLGLTPATVSEGVKRLVTEGYVTIDSRDIALTQEGRVIAEALVRRHRLAERMLVDILGIPWHLCHEQAEDWEKVMTVEVEEAILSKLSGEATCPHGNPIPGVTQTVTPWSDLKPVAAMEQGDGGRLTRLLEDVELNHEVLSFLEEHRLMPGHDLAVVAVAPDGTRTLTVDGEQVAVGRDMANNLWVLPA
ncbi:MAG: DtxR family transcriptional regulator, Mn-dependent transcriptional regulator [Actinomycetota bacterium]|jgi:DtxR family transcriptional regulator, Mn-dependent transcriptional regulator|nr:DtxR family transcriptional regulator, Mn-dependent transcriptional regulator [Actinomycetota bacterium]